ncbi:MAG: radical SAM protein, partial [Thermodesulfovibrio sp.]|nr:radical SAM protein [Thermodesulfovibrio sp.]
MRKIIEKINLLLQKEKGTIRKEHGGRIKICLLYPNFYRIGISNLGFQTVYRLFNERKDVVCERSFLPSQDELTEYKETTLISFESKTPLYEFDILAFSLCFENDYPNILKILDFAKIPMLSKERKPNQPLLIAGGVLCFSNPEPIANIFDVIFVGEAEDLIDNFITIYREVKQNSYEQDFKYNLKLQLLKNKGFYVPEAYEEIYESSGKIIGRKNLWKDTPNTIKRVFCKDFFHKFSFSQLVTTESIFPNMLLVEAMRGCPFRCRFCLVGHVFNPVRKASVDNLRIKVKETCNLDSHTVGIITPSLSAYGEIRDLIKDENIELSFTSLRADKHTLEIIKHISKRKTLTLAPEAGSERLRRVIKKGILEEDLLMISEKLSETTVENLKLYFMIGLPFEEDEDIDEIIKLIKKIREKFSR